MSVTAQFQDRREAGKLLAAKLDQYSFDFSTLVLAISPDAVPIAYEVANALGAPLDVFLVKRIVSPEFEEIIIGAVASSGERVLDVAAMEQLDILESHADRVAKQSEEELHYLENKYRGDRLSESIEGRKVLLVDEGLNVGITMRAAINAVRARHPWSITAAVPVGSMDACRQIEKEADELICSMMPDPFFSVGAWYADFMQTPEEEITRLLLAASAVTHSQI